MSSSNNNPSFHGMMAALLSGVLGATASCCAKFALAPDSAVARGAVRLLSDADSSNNIILTLTLPLLGNNKALIDITWSLLAEMTARGVFLVLMIACNALMLGAFLTGMQHAGSVAGTALTSSANFMASTLYGYVLFGETRAASSPTWWLGFTMVLAGVALLSSASAAASPQSNSSKPATATHADAGHKKDLDSAYQHSKLD